jgi:hypothetical protein
MSTNKKIFGVAPILGAMAFTLILSTTSAAQGGPGGNQTAPRSSRSYAVEPATADETKRLVYMREEEKLARDVYQFLYERWNLGVFDRIAASEQRHFSSIGTLLARYNVTDPARNDTPGVFTEPKLAALYTDLIAKGALSLKDALEVGVLIEKTDIADIESALKVTLKTDIKRVYTNLLNGSYNHLEAFEANLEVLCLAP